MRRSLVAFAVALALIAAPLAGAFAQSSVTIVPKGANPVNCSGQITTGGVAQKLALPAGVHFYQLQNLALDLLGFSEFTATPAIGTNGTWTLNGSTSSVAGGSYTSPPHYVPNTAVYVIAATTGDGFTCVAW